MKLLRLEISCTKLSIRQTARGSWVISVHGRSRSFSKFSNIVLILGKIKNLGCDIWLSVVINSSYVYKCGLMFSNLTGKQTVVKVKL